MNNEARWQAVLTRDKSSDGQFVYAVSTTGIYCRPTCPSRRPGREHVLFFEGPSQAEAAGFRACLRCRPAGSEEPGPQAALVQRAREYIEGNVDGDVPLTLEAIGAHLGVSPYHLQRVFKRLTGVSPRQYAASMRLEHLKQGLRNGTSNTVTEAMYDAGYSSSSRLYEAAPAALGMTPHSYKKGGKGMEITFTTASCSLGRVLVGATARGICAVSLGDTDEELERGLRAEYPAAHIQRDGKALRPYVSAIVAQIDGATPGGELPVDVQATAFQWRVWQELRTIPFGSTRSYSQVARAIGQPNARRAVAQACATNHVALVIPCHRVVKDDGSAGGYKWGVERKRALLAAEKAAAASGAGISLAPEAVGV